MQKWSMQADKAKMMAASKENYQVLLDDI